MSVDTRTRWRTPSRAPWRPGTCAELWAGLWAEASAPAAARHAAAMVMLRCIAGFYARAVASARLPLGLAPAEATQAGQLALEQLLGLFGRLVADRPLGDVADVDAH